MKPLVLIAEDDRKVAMAIAMRLEQEGCSAITASSVTDAVDLVLARMPQLLVADICLRGGSAFDLAESVLEMGGTLPPTIFLTASGRPGLRQRAMDYNGIAFLTKPYDPQEFRQAIQRGLIAGLSAGHGNY